MSRQHELPLRRAAFLDVNSFPMEEFTNGANIQYREILIRLFSRGVEGAVLTVAHNEMSPRRLRGMKRAIQRNCTILDGIPVIEYLVQPSPEQDPEAYRLAIQRALAEFSPDLIFINTPPARLIEIEVVLAEELAQFGSMVFCFVPDDQFPRPGSCEPSFYYRYQKCLINFRLMCPSQFIANQVKTSLHNSVEYMPNLFTYTNIVCDSVKGNSITLVNPHPMKGIRVFEAIAGRMPHLPFLVVHGWPYPPHYTGGHCNTESVPFQRDMRSVWERTKILLVPSLCNEGYGRIVIEAMLNGIPVIAHNKGGLSEACGGAAIMINPPPIAGDPVFPVLEPDDLESLVEEHVRKIDSLLIDENRYEAFSRRSRETATAICNEAEVYFNQLMGDFSLELPEENSTQKIIVFSPHADDVAFSLGGVIQKAILKFPVHILTLFGRSNYLRETGFHTDWKEITHRRKHEDTAFASRIGAQLSYLDFPDASLRLGASFDAIFTDGSETDLPIPPELESMVQHIFNDTKPAILFSPLGLGGHHDHLLARKLAQKMADRWDIALVYYEDLPYAAELSEEKLLNNIHSLGLELQPTYVPIGSELERKLENLLLYRSQIGPEELNLVRNYTPHSSRLGVSERLWSCAFPLTFLRVA